MRLKQIIVAVAITALSGTAAAKFPEKPITLVVPYAAGGNVDISTRILQKALGDSLGQPVVVENRPGGGGMIAGSYVARSAPDGHVLFVGSNGPVLFGPMTSENAPYEWEEAFEPVSTLAEASNLFLVRADFPVRDMKEFVDYAKDHPEEVLVGVSSLVSINHFLGLLLKQKTGIEWTEVFYNGNAPAITDLVAGEIDVGLQQVLDAKQHINDGTLRALAVGGSERVDVLPDVPTMAEAGIPGVEGITFNGVFAPKGTPSEVVDLLSEKIQVALQKPEVKEQFANLGSKTGGSSAQEFSDFLKAETAKWKEVLEKNAQESGGGDSKP